MDGARRRSSLGTGAWGPVQARPGSPHWGSLERGQWVESAQCWQVALQSESPPTRQPYGSTGSRAWAYDNGQELPSVAEFVADNRQTSRRAFLQATAQDAINEVRACTPSILHTLGSLTDISRQSTVYQWDCLTVPRRSVEHRSGSVSRLYDSRARNGCTKVHEPCLYKMRLPQSTLFRLIWFCVLSVSPREAHHASGSFACRRSESQQIAACISMGMAAATIDQRKRFRLCFEAHATLEPWALDRRLSRIGLWNQRVQFLPYFCACYVHLMYM